MAYRCDYCGAFLDPGEKCTCYEEKLEMIRLWSSKTKEDDDGQLTLVGAVTAGTGDRGGFTDDLPF